VGRKGRRARHERRDPDSAGPVERVSPEAKREAKAEQKRRAAFEESRRRLNTRRNVIGLIGLIPLVASLFAVPFPFDVLGLASRDVWLLLWAAVFGSFLGLTIRLVLDRRRFERGARSERPA